MGFGVRKPSLTPNPTPEIFTLSAQAVENASDFYGSGLAKAVCNCTTRLMLEAWLCYLPALWSSGQSFEISEFRSLINEMGRAILIMKNSLVKEHIRSCRQKLQLLLKGSVIFVAMIVLVYCNLVQHISIDYTF